MFALLPLANEVWGKVIFLHLFVILFTGGVHAGPGGVHWGVCMWGVHRWMRVYWGVLVAGGHAWLGVCVAGGVHGQGGCACHPRPPPEPPGLIPRDMVSQWAGGMHPTGMHSCFFIKLNDLFLFQWQPCEILCLQRKYYQLLHEKGVDIEKWMKKNDSSRTFFWMMTQLTLATLLVLCCFCLFRWIRPISWIRQMLYK